MEDTYLAHDLHLSRLVGWVLRRVGVAVLLGAAVAAACGIFAAIGHDATWFYVGAVVAPLVFGGYLATVSAPLPDDETDYSTFQRSSA